MKIKQTNKKEQANFPHTQRKVGLARRDLRKISLCTRAANFLPQIVRACVRAYVRVRNHDYRWQLSGGISSREKDRVRMTETDGESKMFCAWSLAELSREHLCRKESCKCIQIREEKGKRLVRSTCLIILVLYDCDNSEQHNTNF